MRKLILVLLLVAVAICQQTQFQPGVIGPPTGEDIVFTSRSGATVKIDTNTGKVEFSKGLTPDAAARIFWADVTKEIPCSTWPWINDPAIRKALEEAR